MTPGDPDRRIPSARLEPRGLADQLERAGATAKHGARRVRRIGGVVLSVRRVLRAGVVVTVGLMLLVLIAAGVTSGRRVERESERLERRDRARMEEARRRAREHAKSKHAEELERRAAEVQREIEGGRDPFDPIDPEVRRKYLFETRP